MTCLIVEDQPPAQRILKKYIEDMGTLQLQAVFSDAIQALEYLRTHQVDVLFLDIHLPKISGMDLLKSLPHPPAVILTTAFSDYALESYEYNVVDYLLKPFSFARFAKAIAKIPAKQEELMPSSTSGSESKEKDYAKEFFVKSGHEHIKVQTEEILFIKSDADYTEIVLDQKKYLSQESLKHWLQVLNPEVFYRVHKSYIANTSKIAKVSGNQVFLENGLVLPIGRAYKENFVKEFLSTN